MAEGATRQLVVCDKCGGSGYIKVSPYTMIGKTRYVDCTKCESEGFIRSPKPPPNVTQDLT